MIMVLAVSEVKKKIEDLQRTRENFMKLQNYCLGINEFARKSTDNSVSKRINELEANANLNDTFRNLCTKAIQQFDFEINRLEQIILEAKVSI